MKHLFLFLTILSTQLFAQKGSISGTVAQLENNETVPFATITMGDKNTISNDEGYFNINKLTFGTYLIRVEYIGFQTFEKTITLNKNTPNAVLGTVLLKTNTIGLDEVEINAKTKTLKTSIDKKTYNASNFETAKGGNAVDVLSRLPSVSVDNNGNVSIRGSQDFTVYINGKPTQTNSKIVLQQIPANLIDKVDVIAVPTAKYDAQGKGGIININTKKNALLGTSITVNGLLGGAPWGEKTDIYSGYKLNDNRYAAGLQMTHNLKNVALHGGINYTEKNVNGKRKGEARVLIDNSTTPDTYLHLNAEGERPEIYKFFTANAGIDIDVFKKDKISISYLYGDQTAGRDAYYLYNTFNAAADGVTNKQASANYAENIYNPNIDRRFGIYHNINADYILNFNDKEKLNISAAYETSDLSRKLSNRNFNLSTADEIPSSNAIADNAYGLSDSTPLDGFRVALDYSKQINEASSINYGLQSQNVNIAGDFKFDNISSPVIGNLDNSIDLTRNVSAAYVDYRAKRGSISYIFGLRTEYMDQDLKVSNTDYLSLFSGRNKAKYTQQKLDWFPSLHITNTYNNRQKIGFAASRRINRPSVTKLAPFLYRRHFEVYVVGDPELKPEYLNNIELNYDTKIGKSDLNLTAFYRGVENSVFRVNTTTTQQEDVRNSLNEDVLIRSYTNAGDSSSIGLEAQTNIKLGSKVQWFVGGSVYQYNIKGNVFGYDVDTESTNWTLKTNILYNISSEISFNADYNYISDTVTSQGSNDFFNQANIALTYQPKKVKGLHLSLRGLDVLSTNVKGLDTNAFNAAGEQIFYQETAYTRFGPIAELAVTYTFNQKNKKKQKEFLAKKHFK